MVTFTGATHQLLAFSILLEYGGALQYSARHLILFRARSRHTYGFGSVPFDLPQLEISSLVENLTLSVVEKTDDPQLFWAEGASSSELSAAAQRSILVHGLYMITATAETPKATGIAAKLALGSSPSKIDVIDLAQPNLQRKESAWAIASFRDGLGNMLSRTSAAELLDQSRSWVLLRGRHTRRFYFGWRIAQGLAAGRGAPGISAGRRCYSGVLGRYSLKDRLGKSPTAMEPELAFLMASLARIKPSTRVLDPTCGSCGLLLIAAALGSSDLVGVDCDPCMFRGVAAEFERQRLPMPKLIKGNVINYLDEVSLNGSFDAILCDPPYDIRAPVWLEGEETSGSDVIAGPNHDRDGRILLDLTGPILSLADRVLSPGGRVVLFVPARGGEARLSIEALLERRLPVTQRPFLRLILGRRQDFPTRSSRRKSRNEAANSVATPFVRWLAVLEKMGDKIILSR